MLDETYLKNILLWTEADDRVKRAFRDELGRRQLGREETIDAWFWFHTGWTAFQVEFT